MAVRNSVSQPEAESCRTFAQAVSESVGRTMFDMTLVTKLSLVALYSDGHVLLEGNPGLGKTDFVKTLGRVLGFDNGRIQFTPDLMPADITGTKLPSLDGSLEFNPGPVFTTLLLADEINRATPKTQSAMLEAMAERQVTVLGEQWKLMPRVQARQEVRQRANGVSQQRSSRDDGQNWPFMVLATQNPIDQEGTYNLPEAQADRFMFKVLVTMPGSKGLRRIMNKTASPVGQTEDTDVYSGLREAGLLGGSDPEPIHAHTRVRDLIKRVEPLPSVEEHVCNAVLASNGRWDELGGLMKRLPAAEQQRLVKMVKLMPFGLGPRAASGLLLGSKAWALFFQTGSLPTADARALARVFAPCVRHRLRLEYDWERSYFELFDKQAGGSQSSPHLNALGMIDELDQRLKDSRAKVGSSPKRGASVTTQIFSGTPWRGLTALDLFIIDFCLLTAPRLKDYDYGTHVSEEFRLMLASD